MSLPELTKALAEFAAERNWNPPVHSPKNFAMALMVEAGELMDPLQWCDSLESCELVKNPEVKAYLTKEIGDILINLLQFARHCDVDAEAAAWDKLAKLKQRYDPAKLNPDGFTRIEESTGEAQFKSLSGGKKNV